MSNERPADNPHFFYNASAYGVSGELVRPIRQTISSQAATSLAVGGGHGSHQVDNYNQNGVSFRSSRVEVAGSYDAQHGIHTIYSTSIIDKLSIADVIKADKVVSRLAIYSSKDGASDEPRFDITGSHFENLRICGHLLNIRLSTHVLHQHQTYSELHRAIQGENSEHLLPWGKLDGDRLDQLKSAENDYRALSGVGDLAKGWNTKKKQAGKNGTYWCSAAGHFDLQKELTDTELQGFGGIICIPKFGIVRLAEVMASRHNRSLTMLRVQMCSTGEGSVHAGGTTGGGTAPPG